MGYYVEIIDCEFTIKSENLDKAYELLCELNAHDELKICGAHPATMKRPTNSKSLAKDPNKWFSWMRWNYDEHCKTAIEILELVGFDVNQNDEGSIVELFYWGKTGDEEHFLNALAPIVEEGSYIVWEGEEHERWKNVFEGKEMKQFPV